MTSAPPSVTPATPAPSLEPDNLVPDSLEPDEGPAAQPGGLKFHDSHSRTLTPFVPLDPADIRVYFCGPTVYDRVHLGNLRAMLCADMLIRVLRARFPKVTFVRNITDIDDKIINRARETGESLQTLTERTTREFHEDLKALNVLPPDIEPRATAHISEMLAMIEGLIARGHAYEAEGHVLFSVSSFEGYGQLSGRSAEDMLAGARVEVAPYKRAPDDFVLWKPSTPDQPGWESPYGRGRPGWHLECSAMSERYLGTSFDIHGGGQDLLFPHHENERAQSLCAHPGTLFARTWLHVGMLRVDGEKMSKSLGNFHTIRAALERAPAEALRLLFLGTHYRATLDFSWDKLAEARRTMDRFYRALEKTPPRPGSTVPHTVARALDDDLNTALAVAELHQLADRALGGEQEAADALLAAGQLMGLFSLTPEQWFQGGAELAPEVIEELIAERLAARKARDFARADAIRAELAAKGILLEDGPGGTTWRKG
ncbi:cysteine--tRNA ligase [Oecophyllibacter saccharovorans]|uniref:cysteine--tRNA ligase n=1 Tax=Oecophyllibacter saccharovorans TaxID=2558360 RepID=UPI001144B3E2|nr:cysteine--tRNA ligase [Oecophyllibacter saccharovorans]QDH15638.1 cysteine--tRNA ligase [Oecophyllibacter saccharovorans]